VLAPPLATFADNGGIKRRFTTTWSLYGAASILLTTAALLMLIMLRARSYPLPHPAPHSISHPTSYSTPHSLSHPVVSSTNASTAAPASAAQALTMHARGGGVAAGAAVLVAMVAAADVLCQLAIPNFWAYHNHMQRLELRGVSIALVNSLGNLGGFFGPWVLGALHDVAAGALWRTWPTGVCDPPRLRPLSPSGAPGGSRSGGSGVLASGCMAQWGVGLAFLGVASLLMTTATALMAWAAAASIHPHMSRRELLKQ